LAIRKQIVCIDDLERAGSTINLIDVLGLASDLKATKECKVILLLNEDALFGNDAISFRYHVEKVCDRALTFDPTPAEASELGLDPSTEFYSDLRDDLISLSVTNIRVVKRAEHFYKEATELLSTFDQRIKRQAVHTIALAAYSRFQPYEAPSLSRIRSFNSITYLMDKRERNKSNLAGAEGAELTDDERHSETLIEYNFMEADELDLILIDGVQAGFFEVSTLQGAATRQAERLNRQDQDNSFSEAWSRVHNSFADDQNKVLPALAQSIRANVRAISPLNLNGTVRFLKEFGWNAEAQEALSFYVANRDEIPSFWDLSNNPFMDKIDPDVEAAFLRKLSETKPSISLMERLERLAGNDGWSAEDLAYLSDITKDEYVKLFKELNGEDLNTALKGALLFRNVSNADDDMRKITSTVVAALDEIASESSLNAWRVSTRLRRR